MHLVSKYVGRHLVCIHVNIHRRDSFERNLPEKLNKTQLYIY